jgi:hypothetical protein
MLTILLVTIVCTILSTIAVYAAGCLVLDD